jgi:hypothetical protein
MDLPTRALLQSSSDFPFNAQMKSRFLTVQVVGSSAKMLAISQNK